MIRTLHHQAATGGTLISKCIAAMNNVQLLSEVNPVTNSKLLFSPPDMFAQYQAQYGVKDEGIKNRYFNYQLELILECCKKTDSVLVLRDHNHTSYMWKNPLNRRPLLEFLSNMKTKSLVTIRDPIDSFISCSKYGWLNHIDNDFDLYCERVLLFLKDYSEFPIIKYEDFCHDPIKTMKEICLLLELNFREDFIHNFSDIVLTGDSGRKVDNIVVQKRRPIPDSLKLKISESTHYRRICEIYSYTVIDY